MLPCTELQFNSNPHCRPGYRQFLCTFNCSGPLRGYRLDSTGSCFTSSLATIRFSRSVFHGVCFPFRPISLIMSVGHAVVQLVEALRYKPESRGFDSCWCLWNFSLTLSFQPHYGPGVDSASNRNEYQEYFLGDKGSRCVQLTTLPPSCANCLEIWEPHPPGTLRACPGL